MTEEEARERRRRRNRRWGILTGATFAMADSSGTNAAGGGPGPSPIGTAGAIIIVTDQFANMTLESFWFQRRGTWTESTTTAQVSCTPAASPNPRGILLASQTFSKVRATVNVGTVGSREFHLFVCGSWNGSAFSGYSLGVNAFNWGLQRWDADTATALDGGALFLGAGDQIRVEYDPTGTSISCYHAGGLLTSVSDATYTTGQVGIGANAAGSHIFTAFDARTF